MLLVALTVLSFETSMPWLQRSGLAAALALGLALIKIRVVLLHFMEVADAPSHLRVPLEAWVVLLGVLLLGLWYGLIV